MKKWFQEFKIELLNLFKRTPQYCAKILHIFTLLVGFGIALVLAILWIAPHASKLYHHIFTISLTERKEINIEDKRHIEYLLLKNKIIPISEVYNHTLEYYNSLISILVALLGIFAFLAWVSLRTKIKEDVQQEIEKFFSSQQTIAWLNELFKKKIDENKEWLLADQENLINKIEENVLAQIEEKKIEEISEREE